MAREDLTIYVTDHLGGAQSALRLLKDLRRRHAGNEIGALAAELHHDVSVDRAILRRIGKRIGVRRRRIKETAAWFAGLLSRMLFDRERNDGLGTFQKLEVLSLGIEGKRMLWNTLANAENVDRRLTGFDFAGLGKRASRQRGKVDEMSASLSAIVFTPQD